jgi:di/tripeptidase
VRSSFGIEDRWLFQATGNALLREFKEILPRLGRKKIISGKEFVYAAGKTPVLLCAHVDTVHSSPPKEIFYDREKGVLWSPQGLGADDRAGVLGILELLRRGLHPHVLLLDGEETGCTGAKEAVAALRAPKVRYIIELDRRNGTEAVFYDCENAAFEEYVASFGFVRAEGTFTDITVLCPAWGIAGVNLSCGYYHAHSATEYLNLRELWGVLGKVEKMLRDVPSEPFEHVPAAPVVTDGELFGSWKATRGVSRWAARWDIYDVCVEVDVGELVAMFGGTRSFWEAWLDHNYWQLSEAAQDAVYSKIEEMVATGVATEQILDALDD